MGFFSPTDIHVESMEDILQAPVDGSNQLIQGLSEEAAPAESNSANSECGSAPSASTNEDQDHPEMTEDEKDVTETSAPLVSCLQPTDFSQYISDFHEDDILCIAPGEGSHPQSAQNKEGKSFPTLFPDNQNTFCSERKVKLSISQYIKSRLYSRNNKYASNSEYIFYLQYLKELNEVLSSVKISLRKGIQRPESNVTVQDITNPERLRSMFHRNEGYKFLSKVRGSAELQTCN